MSSGKFDFKTFVAKNEEMPSYSPMSDERKQLEETLERYTDKIADIPIIIGDEQIRTSEVKYQVCVSIEKSQSSFTQISLVESKWLGTW